MVHICLIGDKSSLHKALISCIPVVTSFGLYKINKFLMITLFRVNIPPLFAGIVLFLAESVFKCTYCHLKFVCILNRVFWGHGFEILEPVLGSQSRCNGTNHNPHFSIFAIFICCNLDIYITILMTKCLYSTKMYTALWWFNLPCYNLVLYIIAWSCNSQVTIRSQIQSTMQIFQLP